MPTEEQEESAQAEQSVITDETAGILDRIKAYATGKTALANSIAGLQKQVNGLTEQLAERDASIASLTSESGQMRADLAAFADWLAVNGTPKQEAAANPAAAFQTAVGEGVANVVRQIGVPAATLNVAASSAGAGNESELTDLVEQIASEKDSLKKGQLTLKARAIRQQLSQRSLN